MFFVCSWERRGREVDLEMSRGGGAGGRKFRFAEVRVVGSVGKRVRWRRRRKVVREKAGEFKRCDLRVKVTVFVFCVFGVCLGSFWDRFVVVGGRRSGWFL